MFGRGSQGRFRSYKFSLVTAHSRCSGVYLVWDRFRSDYLLGGYRINCTDRSLTTMATTAAIWEAMRYSRDELNLKHFDLEGSMIPGVELFFRKFGGVLTPFYVISWARP